jgi:chromosome segregation ATPase
MLLEEEITTTEVADELNPLNREELEETEEISVEEETEEEIDVEKIEIEDPSHTEGLTEEEKKAYSKGVQKRIGGLTKKMREAEREAKKAKEEKDKEIAKIKSDYEQKMRELETQRKQKEVKEEGPDIKVQIKALRVKRAKAAEEMDMTAVMAIQDEIDELEDAEADKRQKAQPDIKKIVAEQEVAVARKVFYKNNPWFSPNPIAGKANTNYDREKSNYALTVERELNSEGFTGTTGELFDEIGKQVDSFFKIHRPNLPNVAGVDPTKKVKNSVAPLTAYQRQVVEGLGITEAEYRAQLKQQGAK